MFFGKDYFINVQPFLSGGHWHFSFGNFMSPVLLFYNKVISDKFEDLLRKRSLQLVRIGYLLCHAQCNFC